MENDPKIYKVAEITRLIKELLEDEVGEVWIEGELSNVRRPASGHCYFTIKDESAQISAVMFRGRQAGLRFEPRDGLAVRVCGTMSVYEKSGQYQVIVSRMQAGGKGALQAAFEALKKKLLDEGLFDPDRKRPIPLLPRHIGVVTSPTGAAIRDILNVLSRRFGNLHVVLAPVRVQGEGAAAEIAAAIEALNRMGGFDVLIVGRGGGSMEDLWPFNEETVARAIAGSATPVISAVGHEIDFTISDFVADLRAPTPSAAAELVVGRKDQFEAGLKAMTANLSRALERRLLEIKGRVAAAAGSRVFLEPGHLVRRMSERLMRIRAQLEHGAGNVLREEIQRVDELAQMLGTRARENFLELKLRTGQLEARLSGMNPLEVLKRGYSITTRLNGELLTQAGQARKGERLLTQLASGKLVSEVIEQQ